ncbi:trypsin-like peptidase domain-containing protein [Cylindrospermopsis curvispora]|uniref:Trypsin-like peptidase domain-containing protein n=1 Tax=Cylindrospermopsis curvispora GIHE-G1 TaxID=2666332 RepID=A0A7H0F5X1_9CYAN|nr:trypsin-like peptidase domain-containing protein [Cylindrospermopsis curvispora]QNP31437.1 trypsin-like peptidase domain-containing protein [Cylindrospermopsis curvispora GIHE-G1]
MNTSQIIRPLQSSIVRIYSNSSTIVGNGFLVEEKIILTCAHVVADALGVNRDTIEMPHQRVRLDFPFSGTRQLLEARIVFWNPVRPNQFAEDIAGFELLEDLPPNTAQPARLVDSNNLLNHP